MIAGFAVAVMVCAFVVANAPRGGAVGPGVVDFVSATATVDETDAVPVTVQLMVQRTVGTDGPASVNFAVTGGSAAAAADYTVDASGTLNWVEGDATPQPITITVLPDNGDEPAETVVISLADPVGASLGTATQALVTINNDDDAGTVQFSSAEYAVVENESELEVTVTRAGGSDGEVTVTHSANDVTAMSADYTGGDGTLSWANGDASPRTFTVTIDDDSASEPDET
ncbi:MAG: Calx-beta domain-containing protein, partial [Acidimicrobiia bacterium]